MVRRTTILTLTIAAAAASFAAAASPARHVAARPLVLFVIDGQSNAEGFGVLEQHQAPNPLVLDMLHPDGPRPAVDPLYIFGGERTEGSGFGRFFGNYLVRHAHVRVGLIDCGRGGFPLSALAPDEAHPEDTTYYACMSYVRLIVRRNPSARLGGLLWSQGETDAERMDWASTWASRFEKFVSAFRSDVGEPRLPVVMQRTLDFAQGCAAGLGSCLPFSGIIREQQEIAAATLSDAAIVDADGLPVTGEHFTPAGYGVLGVRMATAWLRLVG